MIPFADIQTVVGKITTKSEFDWAVFGGTATSNINVTIGLALVSFFVIQVHAFKSLGIGGLGTPFNWWSSTLFTPYHASY